MQHSIRTGVDTQPHRGPSAILDSLWWVGRSVWGGLPALTGDDCNIYLLKGRDFDVLIDIGMNKSFSKLEQNIKRAGGHPSRIREIWITHTHCDHFINAAKWIARHPRVVCRVSAPAAKFLKEKNYRLIGFWSINKQNQVRVPARLAAFEDGARLHCPPYTFRTEALTGHTPDSYGFRGDVGGHEVLFSGDAIIGDQQNTIGRLGWLDGLWLSDLKAYERTLKRVVAHPPDLLLPGHGVPHFGASTRRSLRHCLQRVRQLRKCAALQTSVPFPV